MITEIILIAISMSAFWTTFLTTKLPNFINFKPFSCSNCMSFWTTLILTILLTKTIILAISSAALSFFLVEIIKKIIKL